MKDEKKAKAEKTKAEDKKQESGRKKLDLDKVGGLAGGSKPIKTPEI